MHPTPTILVLGSINTDLVLRVPHTPAPGETVLGEDLAIHQGGKGANQAVAAARLGGRVALIGCLGADAYGDEALRVLNAEGVGVRRVRRLTGVPSGVAVIALAGSGENSIIVSPGANAHLSMDDVTAAFTDSPGTGVAVAQLEVPLPTVREFLRRAREAGMTTLLNPSPSTIDALELLPLADVLICNEIEAAMLSGHDTADEMGARVAAGILVERGAGRIVITRGREPTVLFADGVMQGISTFEVVVEDTTGAGDTFVGALAVGLADGETITLAARYASAAAALSVGKVGAREGMPTPAEVTAFLASSPAMR